MYAIGCPQFGYGTHPMYAVVAWNGCENKDRSQKHRVWLVHGTNNPPDAKQVVAESTERYWSVVVCKLYGSTEPIDAVDIDGLHAMGAMEILNSHLNANMVGDWVRQAVADSEQSKDCPDILEPAIGATKECLSCGGTLEYRIILNRHREDIAKGWVHV